MSRSFFSYGAGCAGARGCNGVRDADHITLNKFARLLKGVTLIKGRYTY